MERVLVQGGREGEWRCSTGRGGEATWAGGLSGSILTSGKSWVGPWGCVLFLLYNFSIYIDHQLSESQYPNRN